MSDTPYTPKAPQDAAGDIIDWDAVEENGATVLRVKNGHVFALSARLAEKLYEATKEHGRALVFVKHGASA